MSGAPFTTNFPRPEDLLAGMDLDDVDDLETLLMMAIDRPLTLVPEEVDGGPGIEVVVHSDDCSIGTVVPFPVSVAELVRTAAETAVDVGTWTGAGVTRGDPPDFRALPDGDLVAVLQDALGRTRLLNLLDGGDEDLG
ncbi:hypothetical protein [Nocardioides sp. J54]|uniref:hypothetical protein n=1 Tax=Nocardioides sp. J54 TaxID=935866 RepID=UPI00048DB328|nr:hypothetical protein [Nocardioides sp. J54]